ncbi:unnamed protein product [Lactuca virosa]|uniref:Uncharacterized protein n=1 Tax=Lactuca virosa TaxID=75947 RepID=A0AAU9NIV2_9ASTR|nr:unnamed protein product [Lactuca virosa]
MLEPVLGFLPSQAHHELRSYVIHESESYLQLLSRSPSIFSTQITQIQLSSYEMLVGKWRCLKNNFCISGWTWKTANYIKEIKLLSQRLRR